MMAMFVFYQALLTILSMLWSDPLLSCTTVSIICIRIFNICRAQSSPEYGSVSNAGTLLASRFIPTGEHAHHGYMVFIRMVIKAAQVSPAVAMQEHILSSWIGQGTCAAQNPSLELDRCLAQPCWQAAAAVPRQGEMMGSQQCLSQMLSAVALQGACPVPG